MYAAFGLQFKRIVQANLGFHTFLSYPQQITWNLKPPFPSTIRLCHIRIPCCTPPANLVFHWNESFASRPKYGKGNVILNDIILCCQNSSSSLSPQLGLQHVHRYTTRPFHLACTRRKILTAGRGARPRSMLVNFKGLSAGHYNKAAHFCFGSWLPS